MGFFGSYNVTLNEIPHPFKDKERVVLRIKEFEKKDGQFGARVLFNCIVESGEHVGKEYIFTLYLKDSTWHNNVRRKFLSCFYTQEELISDQYDQKKPIGKAFSAVASNIPARKEGDTGLTLWDLFAKVEDKPVNTDDLPY